MSVQRLLKYNYLKILRLHDKPNHVAMGIAIGTSVMFLPAFGFATPLAYVIALLLKVNRIAAVLASIFWKWAFVGFYTLNYVVGRLILGSDTQISKRAISETMAHMANFNLYKVGKAFLIGSVINAALSGILIYYVTSKILEVRNAHIKARRSQKTLLPKEE